MPSKRRLIQILEIYLILSDIRADISLKMRSIYILAIFYNLQSHRYNSKRHLQKHVTSFIKCQAHHSKACALENVV